ncbi:hypothetical protein T4B_13639 [Trichinella pseudospiralis]|uniref:Uncharacterized protein n=1 Tax=Trichinella pseudospiralis TaxID=6337 RepID=A0A0V0XV56_TRIPS|nr:hypothetical protein T4E_6443 [Trichinella pseudospiralis]KRY73997.1 hypothetical protein T4A_5474 [Trichinella pseudospiralis]KRZ31865.1 hypothetical protein T4B_13639 [Trichinella pseudospiralis]
MDSRLGDKFSVVIMPQQQPFSNLSSAHPFPATSSTAGVGLCRQAAATTELTTHADRQTTDGRRTICLFILVVVHPTDRRPDLNVVKDKHILLAAREKPFEQVFSIVNMPRYVLSASLFHNFHFFITTIVVKLLLICLSTNEIWPLNFMGQGVVLFTCPDFSCPTGSYCTERVRVHMRMDERFPPAGFGVPLHCFLVLLCARRRSLSQRLIVLQHLPAPDLFASGTAFFCICSDGQMLDGIYKRIFLSFWAWLACELDQQKLTNKINLFRRRIASKSGLGTFVSGPVGWLVSFATNCLSLAACSWLVGW